MSPVGGVKQVIDSSQVHTVEIQVYKENSTTGPTVDPSIICTVRVGKVRKN